jgi:Na+/melibiose symporter-like transporter
MSADRSGPLPAVRPSASDRSGPSASDRSGPGASDRSGPGTSDRSGAHATDRSGPLAAIGPSASQSLVAGASQVVPGTTPALGAAVDAPLDVGASQSISQSVAHGGLWRHRDFMRLWGAQAVSAFGSRITRTALPIIAVKTLGVSEAMVATLAALQLAPGVVLALFTGGFVDRGRKRRILVAADLFRAAVILSLTLAWALGALSMLHVIVVGAAVGAATALFQITDVAYLPLLVGKHHLAEGNAKLEATEAVAEVTGPASAGALIAALGAPLAVAIDALSYVWSAVMLGRIRTHEPPPEPAPTAESSTWQSSRDMRVGMQAVFGHRLVRPIVLALMVSAVSSGFFVSLYTLFCLRTLGLSEATFGVIVAMGGIGSLGGALISRPLARAIGVGPTIIACSALSMLAALFIPLAHGPYTLAFLGAHQLLSDGFQVAFIIQAVTLRQTVLPREILGRANAAILVCTAGVLPGVAIGAGILAELTSIRFAVWVGVAIGLAVPLFLLPLRRLREMPTG